MSIVLDFAPIFFGGDMGIKEISETVIERDDLSEAMQEIADCIGMESLLKLMKTYGGSFIYISTLASARKCARDRAIRQKLRKGAGYHEVALEYGLSDSWVRKISSGHKKNQLSLF